MQETAARDIQRRLVVKRGAIQCNQDANGSLIAVSYEARAAGVKRNDRGLEAIQKCLDLNIVQVPVKRGKADLSLYRSASARVFKVLVDSIRANSPSHIPVQVEIASIDEVYVDVTEATKVLLKQQQDWDELIAVASNVTTVGGIETLTNAAHAANALKKDQVRKGSHLQIHDTNGIDEGSLTWWNRTSHEWTDTERRLAVGAFLGARARAAVMDAFGAVFTLSGGVSSNKTLAKLASGLKKPNRQTLIHRGNQVAMEKLFYPLPLDRIRGLGAKLGVLVCEKLNVTTLGQLAQVSLVTLSSSFSEDMARFLYDIGRGICRDTVAERTKPKSIACSKTFRGKLAINNVQTLRTWTDQLCGELKERVSADREEHSRIPKLLAVHVRFVSTENHVSKSCAAPRALESFSEACLDLIQKLAATKPEQSIIGLGVTAASFVDVATGSSSIAAAFERNVAPASPIPRQTFDVTGTDLQAKTRFPKIIAKSMSTMDRWLSQGRDDEDSKKYNSTTERKPGGSSLASANACQKRGTMQQFLSKPTSKVTKRKSSTQTPFSAQDIDPEVWKELPEDIRLSVLRELGSQPKKARRGMASFFGPSVR